MLKVETEKVEINNMEIKWIEDFMGLDSENVMRIII